MRGAVAGEVGPGLIEAAADLKRGLGRFPTEAKVLPRRLDVGELSDMIKGEADFHVRSVEAAVDSSVQDRGAPGVVTAAERPRNRDRAITPDLRYPDDGCKQARTHRPALLPETIGKRDPWPNLPNAHLSRFLGPANRSLMGDRATLTISKALEGRQPKTSSGPKKKKKKGGPFGLGGALTGM